MCVLCMLVECVYAALAVDLFIPTFERVPHGGSDSWIPTGCSGRSCWSSNRCVGDRSYLHDGCTNAWKHKSYQQAYQQYVWENSNNSLVTSFQAYQLQLESTKTKQILPLPIFMYVTLCCTLLPLPLPLLRRLTFNALISMTRIQLQ